MRRQIVPHDRNRTISDFSPGLGSGRVVTGSETADVNHVLDRQRVDVRRLHPDTRSNRPIFAGRQRKKSTPFVY